MNRKKNWKVCKRENSQRSVHYIRYINYSLQFAKIISFLLKKKDHGLRSVQFSCSAGVYLCFCFTMALVAVPIAA
jgi:hypothetical protein